LAGFFFIKNQTSGSKHRRHRSKPSNIHHPALEVPLLLLLAFLMVVVDNAGVEVDDMTAENEDVEVDAMTDIRL